MCRRAPRLVLPLLLAAGAAPPARAQEPVRAPYRTLDDRMEVRRFGSLAAWQERAAWLREHVLASAGLLPPPARTPLNPVVFDEKKHADYRVAKVYFESLPGFFVTGNLYRPAGEGPFPAIVSPHGHWTYGRLENSETASVPGRAVGLARLGFVVFTYDMIGYDDSRQLPHWTPADGEPGPPWGRRESLWGLSLAGLQLWNSIRSVDFLETLPEVARGRIGATGASGGGTQVFLLAAVDDRVAAAAPVNMISLHMQGGCLCENLPHLRLDTNNVEIAALAAPRPLLMVSATGDWTKETLEREYPEMRRFYDLFGAPERVHAIRVEAEHNYNRQSREAVYAWMSRWLQGAPAAASLPEKEFQVDRLADLLVFHGRTLPTGARSAEEVAESWVSAAERQLAAADPAPFRSALLHVLGFERPLAAAPSRGRPVVVLASADQALGRAIARAGFDVRPVRFTPFDAAAAAQVSHFHTYNRGEASQRAADLVAALSAAPGAMLVADGEAALPGLLAAAVAAVPVAVLDVDGFDAASDAAYLERLYVPGLRRAGGLRTAAGMARGKVVLHNAGEAARIEGVSTHARKLGAAEVVRLLRARW
jgi:dienelactone hydrolase